MATRSGNVAYFSCIFMVFSFAKILIYSWCYACKFKFYFSLFPYTYLILRSNYLPLTISAWKRKCRSAMHDRARICTLQSGFPPEMNLRGIKTCFLKWNTCNPLMRFKHLRMSASLNFQNLKNKKKKIKLRRGYPP
jgi:hypothetical protein